MKKCFKCGEIKPLTEFYSHERAKDGHLNKCKSCTRKDVKERQNRLKQDESWREEEKKRQRDKYYRLNYKEKHKPSAEKKKETMERYKKKYPEKIRARSAASYMKRRDGCHLHHWSYNKKHLKDVMEFTEADHNIIHRYMSYDQERMMYRATRTFKSLDDIKEGDLLDTRTRAGRYYNACFTYENKQL